MPKLESTSKTTTGTPVIIYPAQCECGHLYLEKYQFDAPTEDGVIGFCWCGFCRTRKNVFIKYA